MRIYELFESFSVAKRVFSRDISPIEVDRYIEVFRRDILGRNKASGDEKNIDFWVKKGWNDFKAFVDSRSQENSKTSMKRPKGEAQVLYEDDIVKIMVPLTRAAMCQFGRGTHWCISIPHRVDLDRYLRQGDYFVFVIDKRSKTKWAIRLNLKNKTMQQVYDKYDNIVEPADAEDIFGDLGISFELIVRLAHDQKVISAAKRANEAHFEKNDRLSYLLKTHEGKRSEELERLIVSTRDVNALEQYVLNVPPSIFPEDLVFMIIRHLPKFSIVRKVLNPLSTADQMRLAKNPRLLVGRDIDLSVQKYLVQNFQRKHLDNLGLRIDVPHHEEPALEPITDTEWDEIKQMLANGLSGGRSPRLVEGQQGLSKLRPFDALVGDYGMLVSFNLAHLDRLAKDEDSAEALRKMIRAIREQRISGLKIVELDPRKLRDKASMNAMLTFMAKSISYIASMMKKHLRDDEYQKIVPRLTKLQQTYAAATEEYRALHESVLAESGSTSNAATYTLNHPESAVWKVRINLGRDDVYDHRRKAHRQRLQDVVGAQMWNYFLASSSGDQLDWAVVDGEALEEAGFKGTLLHERPAGFFGPGSSAVYSLAISDAKDVQIIGQMTKDERAEALKGLHGTPSNR